MALLNGMYIFVKTEGVQSDMETGTHPVETGLPLTDYAKRNATRLSLSGYIVGAGYADTLERILQMKNTATLIQYVGRNILSNMLITSFSVDSDNSIKDGISYSMELTEIRVAKSSYAKQSGNTGLQQIELAPGNEKRVYAMQNGDNPWKVARAYFGDGRKMRNMRRQKSAEDEEGEHISELIELYLQEAT